ncbi:MAG: cytochrome b/b6 domain-containing protein [Anaerolineales bacterium]|nr:cytochrome b/b6 domain-containing protein [Anaerolineales bacterium]
MTTTSLPTEKTNRSKKRFSQTLKNYWLDIALFFAFIIDMNTRFTGISIHEWLGIGFGIALIYHLLLHWDWIVSITKRLFGRLPNGQRLRYAIDLVLFVDMVVLTMTGIWISEVAMRQLGIPIAPNFFWRRLHDMTANFAIFLVALHLALDWKWIVSTTKRYIWPPLTRKRRSA